MPYLSTPSRRRSRTVAGLATAALLALTTACSGDADPGSGSAAGADRAGGGSAAVSLTGPLCGQLPAGADPGNPASLAGEPVDVALAWITVLTRFESALRASGLAAELRAMPGLTILAPSDDAFVAKFSQDTVDELMIHDKEKLRGLLKAHLIDGSRSLAELTAAGTVTTLDGTVLTVTRAGAMARFADQVQTVCADYRFANGRIHIVNGVLGNLPTTADPNDPGSH